MTFRKSTKKLPAFNKTRIARRGRKLGTARARRTVDDFIGLLAGKTKKTASVAELNEAAARAWAGLK